MRSSAGYNAEYSSSPIDKLQNQISSYKAGQNTNLSRLFKQTVTSLETDTMRTETYSPSSSKTW